MSTYATLTYEKAALAQLAERSLSKRKVGGSIPPGGSRFCFLLQLIFYLYKALNHYCIK